MGLIKQIQTDLEMGAVRLFNEYYARLLADARELYKDEGLAEDAAMATLEQFISCREKYDPEKGELYPWLKTIMRNNFISSKRVRKNTDTLYVSPDELKILSDSQVNPLNFDEKISSDEEKLVVEAVKTLSPKLREAVMLHYFDDQPLANIARYLKISESSVKNRLFCARKILAHRLADKLGKKKPLAILLCLLLGAGALFGAWEAGLGEWVQNLISTPQESTESSISTIEKENPPMNAIRKTMLAAPLLVTTLATSAAVDVTPFIPEGVTPETPSAGVYTYEYDGDKIVIFADPGSYEFTVPDGAQGVNYLVVGGGGSSGGGNGTGGGGGGAGGMIYAANDEITGGSTFAIKVGAGGVAPNSWSDGNNGEDSSLKGESIDETAKGGGGGSAWAGAKNGGCGGGAGAHAKASGGTGSQGSNGGANTVGDVKCAAGGGGMGGAGGNAGGRDDLTCGNGGDGLPCSITGKEVWYAGGGAGGNATVKHSGGKGGGGDTWQAGTDGLGGGGGGPGNAGGKVGGSGIVVIRCIYKAKAKYTLTLAESDYGTITANPSQDEYQEGSIVAITANPKDETVGFIRWGGDATGSEKTTAITMDGNKTVSAVYGFKLTILPSDGGTIAGATSGEVIEAGEKVTLTAMPNEGYTFISWGGDASGSEPTTTVTMDRPRTVQAYYKDATGHVYTEWGYSNTVRIAGQKYCISVLNKVGNHTWKVPAKKVSAIDYLVVGGGGGGGANGQANGGGGGGAGGLIYKEGVSVAAGDVLSITVGAGGSGQQYGNGLNGESSSLTSAGGLNECAYGGGGGASWNTYNKGTLASGGGGTGDVASDGGPYNADLNQGHAGGKGIAGATCGAGGGGAGGAGKDAGDGQGGPGVQLSITGEPVWYAAGGAGGKSTYEHGLYGSAKSSWNGIESTGGGGGGGIYTNYGSNGGSGVVIIRYAEPTGGFMLIVR